jgi:hypothetical protein
MLMATDKLRQALKLSDTQILQLNTPIGYPE